MSHGPAGEGSKAEPNLVPLLDLVLQLLMFFMITINFVSEQVSADIKLPVAQSARPMEKTQNDVLYLNLNGNGLLEVPGKTDLLKPTEWKSYLRQQYQDAERLAKAGKDGKGEVKTMVVIRADKDNDYKQVFLLLQKCKEAGYRKYQLRAMTGK
jgi:biopolymer transport protein ExbD